MPQKDLKFTITPERIDFIELCEGDYFFHNNIFWNKIATNMAVSLFTESVHNKVYSNDCTVNIVIITKRSIFA